MVCNMSNNRPAKIDQLPVDVSRQDFSDGGIVSFVAILVCWELNMLCLFLARVTNYKCNNIVSPLRAVLVAQRHATNIGN